MACPSLEDQTSISSDDGPSHQAEEHLCRGGIYFLGMRTESAEDIIKGLSERRLHDKPKPKLIIPDNGKFFISEKFHEFCNSVGIQLAMPAEKESWAHGLIESAMKDIKQTASAIQISQPSLEPAVSLLLSELP